MVDSIVTMAAAVKALDKKKGKNLQVLKTGELTTLADYFVLCTAGSTTQIKALCDICEEAVEQAGGELHHKEGWTFPMWSSMCSSRRSGTFTIWSGSGRTPSRWI